MGEKQQISKNSEKASEVKASKQKVAPSLEGLSPEMLPPVYPNPEPRATPFDHRTGQPASRAAVMQMQRQVGNISTNLYLRRIGNNRGIIQRVQIVDPNMTETLYNETNATTNRFESNQYVGGSTNIEGQTPDTRYELTRSSGSVKVNINIKFVVEFGEAPATNVFGRASQSIRGARIARAVPANQQQSARDICTGLVNFWNNKFELVGTRPATPSTSSGGGGAPSAPGPTPPTTSPGSTGGGTAPAGGTTGPVGGGPTPTGGGPTPPGGTTAPAGGGTPASTNEVTLPVSFVASPVFDLNAPAHTTVRFDATNPANAPAGRVIDAAHWYANVGNYPGGVNDTYAHEYGHLLGIPDEYSISNPQAHALMHQVSPSQATQSNAALDRAGRRELVMSAIRPHLQASIGNLGGEAARALQTQQSGMVRTLATGLYQSWRNSAVLDNAIQRIRQQLTDAGQTVAAREVATAMRFEARQNLSNLTLASQITPQELDPAAVQTIINSTFNRVANAASPGRVTIPYTNERGAASNITFGVSLAPGAQGAASPLNAAAQQAATSAVGTPNPTPAAGTGGGGGRGRRPAVPLYPSNTLLGQLTALPGTWTNVRGQMESVINTMPTDITTALNEALATDISGQVNNSIRLLYETLYNLVTNISQTVLRNTIRSFLDAQIFPVVQNQLDEILRLVEGEPERHTTATGTGTDAAPSTPPDPQLLAAAQQMRNSANQLLSTNTPAGGGAAQTGVTYTAYTLMGANAAGQSLRAEQVRRIQENFNSTLLAQGEQPFTIRTVAPGGG